MPTPYHPKRPGWSETHPYRRYPRGPKVKVKAAPLGSWWARHAVGARDDAQFAADLETRWPARMGPAEGR